MKRTREVGDVLASLPGQCPTRAAGGPPPHIENLCRGVRPGGAGHPLLHLPAGRGGRGSLLRHRAVRQPGGTPDPRPGCGDAAERARHSPAARRTAGLARERRPGQSLEEVDRELRHDFPRGHGMPRSCCPGRDRRPRRILAFPGSSQIRDSQYRDANWHGVLDGWAVGRLDGQSPAMLSDRLTV